MERHIHRYHNQLMYGKSIYTNRDRDIVRIEEGKINMCAHTYTHVYT